MKFMRRTEQGVIRSGTIKNEDILTELKIESITDYIKYYQENWRSYVNRMDAGRFPKTILRYRPQEKRSKGSPTKKWRENPRPQQASRPNKCQEEEKEGDDDIEIILCICRIVA
jgi:hypothetical protein